MGQKQPLAVDLYCGLGGWTEGLLAEGYRVVGFDIERHRYPLRRMVTGNEDDLKLPAGNSASRRFSDRPIARISDIGDRAEIVPDQWMEYPAQMVIQDVLTLHGSQFKEAALIVASPPCQAYSYRAMPWKRAKALPPPDNALFEACFRIQREACEAAGRHIPLVVENVRGAQPWVGRARFNYGSYYLWGDVPALMPIVTKAQKFNPDGTRHPPGSWFAIADSKNRGSKNTGGSWFNVGSPGQKEVGRNPVHELTGRKVGKDWFGGYGGGFGWDCSPMRRNNSKSTARKAASAAIAKIPLPLARYIAQAWWPR